MLGEILMTKMYTPGLESFKAANEQEIVARKLDFLSDGGEFLYLRKGEDVVADSAGEQTKQALENIKAILAAADMELIHVVQAQVFLADIADFAKMNEVYASYFTGDFPTRAAFGAVDLPAGAKVEILATAIK